MAEVMQQDTDVGMGTQGRTSQRSWTGYFFSPQWPPFRSYTALKTFPLPAALLNQQPWLSQLSLQEWGLAGWEASTQREEIAKADGCQCSDDGAMKVTLPPLHWFFKKNRGDTVSHFTKWKMFA